MNRLVLLLLMLLVVLSPLPLGSNREWSWTLCTVVAALITVLWIVTRGWRKGEMGRFVLQACFQSVLQPMTYSFDRSQGCRQMAAGLVHHLLASVCKDCLVRQSVLIYSQP